MKVKKPYSGSLTFIITGDEYWASSGFFNPNAYPQYLKPTVMSCQDRLALILYYYKRLESQLVQDKKTFVHQINKEFTGLDLSKPKLYLAYFHGMGYRASLHGILYSLKSLLDLLAILWVSLIIQKRKSRGFSKGKVNGKIIAGGKLINWIRTSSPSTFKNKEKLAILIETNSQKWISQSVKYRDTYGHLGEIGGLTHLTVMLQNGRKQYFDKDVIMPEMPDGTSVEDYCRMIVDNISNLIADATRLLPNVKISLVKNGDKVIIKYLEK